MGRGGARTKQTIQTKPVKGKPPRQSIATQHVSRGEHIIHLGDQQIELGMDHIEAGKKLMEMGTKLKHMWGDIGAMGEVLIEMGQDQVNMGKEQMEIAEKHKAVGDAIVKEWTPSMNGEMKESTSEEESASEESDEESDEVLEKKVEVVKETVKEVFVNENGRAVASRDQVQKMFETGNMDMNLWGVDEVVVKSEKRNREEMEVKEVKKQDRKNEDSKNEDEHVKQVEMLLHLQATTTSQATTTAASKPLYEPPKSSTIPKNPYKGMTRQQRFAEKLRRYKKGLN